MNYLKHFKHYFIRWVLLLTFLMYLGVCLAGREFYTLNVLEWSLGMQVVPVVGLVLSAFFAWMDRKIDADLPEIEQ